MITVFSPIFRWIQLNFMPTNLICIHSTFYIRLLLLTDIDECHINTDDCHHNAACTNTDGSYTCSCNQGYIGDGRSNCERPIRSKRSLNWMISGICNLFFYQCQYADNTCTLPGYSAEHWMIIIIFCET